MKRKLHGDDPPSAPGDRPPDADGDRMDANSHRARIDRLFRANNESLVRVLIARLHSPQEAREVAQEAYVRLLRLDDPGAVSYLQGLLFKTAVNLANDRLKHEKRKERLEPLVFFETESEQLAPSPDRECSAKEELLLVRGALQELPAMCREVFWLHRIDGLSVEEIAGRMEISSRTVLRYIARALEHCAKVVDGDAAPRSSK